MGGCGKLSDPPCQVRQDAERHGRLLGADSEATTAVFLSPHLITALTARQFSSAYAAN
jgi:hypothetical protein